MPRPAHDDSPIAEGQDQAGSLGLDDAAKMGSTLSPQWGGDLWDGDAAMGQQPEANGGEEQAEGALPRWGNGAPRGGRANGRDQREDRRGCRDPRLAFDREVPHNGYQWWYLDAISDDHHFAVTLIAFIGHVFSPSYYRARQAAALREEKVDPRAHTRGSLAAWELYALVLE